MPVDHFRYDILAQKALRGVVRQVLLEAAKKSLPGEHHFFITFGTKAEGVRLSARMREQYPDEMTIVLQHQFWDLKVTEEAFEVGLSFGGVAERLYVPFDAISVFADPSVQFQLQFSTIAETQDDEAPVKAGSEKTDTAKTKPRSPARHVPAGVPAAPAPAAEQPAAAGEAQTPDKPAAEVVRLDRFRKK